MMTMIDDERAAPRILCVDLETTGLDARRHSIVGMGAVWLLPHDKQGQEFSMECCMWEGAEWTEGAEEINGLSYNRCTNWSLPDESAAVDEFLRWAGLNEPDPEPVILAGLNPSFDRKFLLAAARRAKLDPDVRPWKSIPHRVVDLHTLAMQFALAHGREIPPRGYHTDALYELLMLPPEKRPHEALEGARREAHALGLLLNLGKMEVTA